MNRRTKLLGAVTRAVAVTLTLSVTVGPAAAQEVRDRASTAPSALRASIDRAVEATATVPRRLQAAPVAGQASGGGGKLKTIVTVLGIAASVWATWYTFNWMKKQQEQEKEQAGFRR